MNVYYAPVAPTSAPAYITPYTSPCPTMAPLPSPSYSGMSLVVPSDPWRPTTYTANPYPWAPYAPASSTSHSRSASSLVPPSSVYPCACGESGTWIPASECTCGRKSKPSALTRLSQRWDDYRQTQRDLSTATQKRKEAERHAKEIQKKIKGKPVVQRYQLYNELLAAQNAVLMREHHEQTIKESMHHRRVSFIG
jgi:hypothetical protein